MSNARTARMPRRWAILFLSMVVGRAPGLFADTEWRTPKKPIAKHDGSMVRTDADPSEAEEAPPKPRHKPAAKADSAPQRAVLARLIVNPDQTDGAPPFALTDQTGTVQRYVEPVPGVDLRPYVGQVVGVHNDTGLTLLASQLELPRQPLQPMQNMQPLGASPAGAFYTNPIAAPAMLPMRPVRRYAVDQAQYVDNDDSTVQLLPDDVPMSGGRTGSSPQRLEMMGPYPGPMMQGEMCGPEGCGPQCCDPNMCQPGMMQPSASPMVGPCSQCGSYHESGNCGSCAAATDCEDNRPHIYGDVDFMFFRPRITEDVVGKLSETYEFSPRFTLGVRNIDNLGLRARYWQYGRDSDVLTGGEVRFEFAVLDLEAVHRIEGRRTQVDLAAGIRFTNIRLEDLTGAKSSSDMIGLTAAADGLTRCFGSPAGYCGLVYGGRISLLGGDWGGDDDSAFINEQISDDNMLVTELYAGAEIGRKCGPANVHARAVFEIQNWRSDALSHDANIESISILGPGLQIGAEF